MLLFQRVSNYENRKTYIVIFQTNFRGVFMDKLPVFLVGDSLKQLLHAVINNYLEVKRFWSND